MNPIKLILKKKYLLFLILTSCLNSKEIVTEDLFGNWTSLDKSFVLTFTKDSLLINDNPPFIPNYYWEGDTFFLEGNLSGITLFKSNLEYDPLNKVLNLNRIGGGKNLILKRPKK